MARPLSCGKSEKFRRYRAAKHAQGLRLVRVWVPDPTVPGFREEARRQAALLRSAPEEADALAFLDAAAADIDDWTA